MLPFHDDIQVDLERSDSLVVLARGLGMPNAFARLVLSSLKPNSLIIGLNISRSVATSVIFPVLRAHQHDIPSSLSTLLLPRYISADYSVKDRSLVYEAGGFVIATSNILVHDLLHGALPATCVNGIAIYAADQVRSGSNEHFVLKLFRTGNPNGFVKAFSEAAPMLSRGFHSAEKLMRVLYVSHLSLWPRFHTAVKKSLAGHPPDLVDLSVSLTPRMSALVSALRDCVHAVLEDLRRATKEVDFSEVYKEAGQRMRKSLVYNFDDVVRRQLEGADVKVTARVRALVADLTTLRKLLKDVFELNAVAFYQFVITVRHTAERGHTWLVRKEAQKAILLARSRVWVIKKTRQEESGDDDLVGVARDVELGQQQTPLSTVATLEPTPKWEALQKVLEEIRSDVAAVGSDADLGRVIIAVREQRVVDELKAVLGRGSLKHLKNEFMATFPAAAKKAEEYESQSKADGGMHQITLTQLARPESERSLPSKSSSELQSKTRSKNGKAVRQESERTGWRGESSIEEMREVFRQVQADKTTSEIEVLIWCMEWVDLQGRGHRILEEYGPSFVVLYNTDITVIREVEVYKASHPGRPVRLYILAYDDATEEERFRSASDREKIAFKTLIRERATMSIHVDQEGRQQEEEYTQSLLDKASEDAHFSRRRGLGSDRDSRKSVTIGLESIKPAADAKVLVDTRELRSTLPMLLYQAKINIVSLTLEVGDFILSKNIGIERKSVPDLFGSFGSGRLFNQAEALCRHYKYPCLLIEMDPTKRMSLTGTSGGVPTEISATSIVSKMVLLVQQFPGLRLLWAKGPHDAAEMFSALKANEEEPDEQVAASLGVDTKENQEEQQFNSGPRALLRSLPGIDSQNLTRVMRKVRNVSTLITMTLGELTEVLGSAGKAKLLHDFVNEQPSEALAAL